MLGSLKKIFASDQFKEEAHLVYVSLVEQSRRPWFYKDQAVPDTLDGRFDVIVLHIFLVVHRLRKEAGDEAPEFIRMLSEVFFSDMDRSLREMGSTDTGVGKRIKKMAQAFYGRLHAYETGLQHMDVLEATIKRNIYRDDAGVAPAYPAALAEYIMRNEASLANQSAAEILAGRVRFLD